jgi:hypothetical protein
MSPNAQQPKRRGRPPGKSKLIGNMTDAVSAFGGCPGYSSLLIKNENDDSAFSFKPPVDPYQFIKAEPMSNSVFEDTEGEFTFAGRLRGKRGKRIINEDMVELIE